MAAVYRVETRLLQLLGAIALIAVIGVLAILPYRLYSRDIRHATVQAHRTSAVLLAGISHAIAQGEDVTDLLNRMQGIGELRVHLRPLPEGESHPLARESRGTSHLDGTDLTYMAPPIVGRDGREWLAEMHFDLAPMKRESVRLIIDLVLAVIIGSAMFSAMVFWMVHVYLVVPVRRATHAIEKHDPQTEIVKMPQFASEELSALAEAVETACRAHHQAT